MRRSKPGSGTGEGGAPPDGPPPDGPPPDGSPPGGLLRQAVEALECHYAIFDPDLRLVDYNESYADLHRAAFDALPRPIRYDDLMREAIRRTMPDAGPDAAAAELARRVAAHRSEAPGEFDRLYPGGRWMRVAKRRLADGHVAGIALDITELKRREAVIAAAEARYRALVDTAPVGIWHLDEGGRTLFANARLAGLCGGEAPAGLAQARLRRDGASSALDGPFGFPPGQEVEAALPAGGEGRETRVLVCASDWVPLAGGGGRGAVLTLLDITPLKAAQARAEHLAWHDALTGLANRAWFQRALDGLPAEAHGAALILVDLDRFKEVNDTHGHAAGDALLQEVAARLRATVRPGDLVCRLGGDEFAVLACGEGAASRAGALAGRLADALSGTVRADGADVPLSASVGHAAFPADAPDAGALQHAADLALYAAKHDGRGRAVAFRLSLREAAERRRSLAEALTGAIAGGRLRLVWQAQVDVPGGVLRGAEALVRWPGGAPGGREAGPGEFLPEAEEAGLMPALDAWVLDAALRQARAWAGLPGAPGVVAVNAAAATLKDPGFPARVAAALLRHGVPAPALEIDVPEGVAARDLDAVAPVLEGLRAMGVRIALDDFGGESSSVHHLVRLPVDLMKLDRSVVAGLPGGRERALLRAVAALARGLSIPVLAEGVETDAQAFALRREGCRLMQGHLYGRPVPAEALVPTAARMDAAVSV